MFSFPLLRQGLRHGELTYFRPDGSREEATYVEGYEQGPSTVHFARLEIIPDSVFVLIKQN